MNGSRTPATLAAGIFGTALATGTIVGASISGEHTPTGRRSPEC